MLTPQQIEDATQKFDVDGYATLSGVVPATQLARLHEQLLAEFSRSKQSGELFSGGGTFSGHLNCFPGAQSRFVLQSLTDAGVVDLARRLMPQATRLPNIGCNLNLPNSNAQNNHIDGYAADAFVIINVAPIDTTVDNGAIEITPGTHKNDYKYWQFVLARRPPLRVPMRAGDVLIRSSALWHRGMPNHSKGIRPMLGFTWEDGGSKLDDPYSVHEGKIRFLYNRYTPDLVGRLKERAFATVPSLGSSYLFVRSMLKG